MEPGALEVVLSDFAPHEAGDRGGNYGREWRFGGEKTQQTQEEMEGGKGKRLLIKRQIRVCFFFGLYRVIFFGAFNGCCPAISKRRKIHISF